MHFDVKFEPPRVYQVQLDVRETVLQDGFENVQVVTVAPDPYTGTYDVTPKVDAQTLPTARKTMMQDVIIKAIPYYEVTNDSGGSTVYIAREL